MSFMENRKFESIRKLSKIYCGKAGEFLVTSYLIRNGYNTVPLSIDSGVDLLGHRLSESGESYIFQFQVKTTIKDRIDIQHTEAKLKKYWEERINLVVVFWPQTAAPRILIVPPSLLRVMATSAFKGKPLIRTSDAGLKVVSISLRANGGARIPGTNCNLDIMEERFDLCEDTLSDPNRKPEYIHWDISGY